MYVAVCEDSDCDGGDDLPAQSRGKLGPSLLGKYHHERTGHEIGYYETEGSDD